MTTAVRRLLLSTLLLVAALGAVAHYAFGFFHLDQGGNAWGSDDAYTSYRYALNLAGGHGLVFNPGERVEGYSNLLYVLVATVFAVVAPHAIYGCCVVLNIALWTATLIVFHRYLARTVGPGNALWGVAPLCLYPILWAWPASGLETSAVLLTQLLLFVSADLGSREPSRRATAAFVFLALTSILLRADGFVFPIVCCLAFVVRRRWRQGAFALAAIVILAGVEIAARSLYYGSPLPNTYYAKVSGPLGQRLHSAGQDLSNAGVKDALFLYLIPLTLGWRPFFSAWKRRGVPDVSTLPLMPSVALGLLVYWFFIGGDVFYERFLLVLIPLGAAYFWGGSVDIPTSWKRYATAAALVLQLAPFFFDARFAYQLGKYDRWIDLGKLLALKHPGATLAIDAAGKVPFYSGLQTIDMLGLNDRHIARRPVVWFNVGHSKVDPDYVLGKRPDLVACWGSEWLDMEWGITRDRYEPRGYSLKYVVNASPRPKSANIIDVTGMQPAEVAALYRQGYWYFVIMRGGRRGELPKMKRLLDHPGILLATLGAACVGGCHNAGSAGGTGGSGGSGQAGGAGGTGGATPVMCTGTPTPSGATPTLTPGQWQNISPPGLYRPGASKPPYGCMDIQVSPCNPYVVYLTTDSEGMWRTTDAGATWNQIGNLPVPVSPGVLAIDPRNPIHMYYGGGVRGQSLGFWASTDGGDTWTEPAGFAAKADNSDDGWVNDVYEVKADPADFNHVLVTFHSPWAFQSDAGVLESKDGGNTWIRHLPMAGWGAGHTIWFLGDSTSWLLGTQGDGYWRTSDAGLTWTQVSTQNMQHGGTSAFTSKTGVLYVGALSTILRSEDNGQTFTMVGPQTSDGYYAVIGDGSRLYTARGNTGDSSNAEDTYYVSDESDGTSWVAMNGQTFRDGPYRMSYDKTNGIIYSANWNAGVWALKVDDL